MIMKFKEIFSGIFLLNGKLATKNLVPGSKVYGEELVKIKNEEYRLWDPTRSKLAAAILKGIKDVPIKSKDKILYLGIAHGTTASHISDIIGKEGIIYGVEISERSFRELMPTAQKRGNIVPILADARKPEEYESNVSEEIDAVYVDIADPQQTEVAIRNCKKFLKKGGYLLLAIKARSIDVTRPPKKICQEEVEKLKADFEIIDWKTLDPLEQDHGFVVAKFKA